MYLLLRDNKQSGPLSLEELKTMGLKAYDLVWVEGKSAAWRYPCEIQELSAFAPAVEEQPFDRFYKKAAAVEANGNSSLPSKPASEPASAPASSPLFTREPSTVSGKRIIYVTMPAGASSGRNSAGSAAGNRPVQPAPAPVSSDPAPATYKSESTPSVYNFEDNYSQSYSDERSIVEIPPRSKKQRSAGFVKPLAIGLCILALLAAGIFIGLSINKDSPGYQQKIASKITGADKEQPNHTTAQQLPVPAVTSDPVPTTTRPDTIATIVGQESVRQVGVGQTSPSVPQVSKAPRTTAPKERPANPKTQALLLPASKDSASGTLAVVHREAAHRADPEEKTENTNTDKDATTKLNIASQVVAGANGYTVGTFGGISDLQVTVTNRSAYPLDLVVVEVQYIQSNKKIYKTENLYYRGIGAGSALMQEAPKSSRGIRVQYKITMISSKELGLSYSGI
jgi:hypothetical protein